MVSLPSSVSASPSPNVRAVLALINHLESWHTYESAEQRLAVHSALLAPTLQHHILPRSFGQPVRNKQECLEFSRQVMGMFVELKVTVYELIEGDHSISMHASSQGLSVTGAAYTNEYMMTFNFVESEAGPDALPQISVFKEFLDSDFSKGFFPRRTRTCCYFSHINIVFLTPLVHVLI
ncbi:hypothetical protein SERLA73DRAFT_133791 [Serpula lacrymans var. lacrymans S7.3]|uniref:SnoaL-like domain-containing protein n=1 Tax=Serpula lacrymans var. lacrymans (strain S7.3) TaxID=936435 RepID=F8PSK1_SERL3|nr:hypothetical protein SERLA73DRAFT_133791 [Serpula lacrymans var. lacrymans S7.3]